MTSIVPVTLERIFDRQFLSSLAGVVEWGMLERDQEAWIQPKSEGGPGLLRNPPN